MPFPPRLSVTLTTHHPYPSLLGRVIEVFHQWVSEQVFDDVLVDVADYRHVSQGPGLFIIGHEFNYQLGLRTSRWEFSCVQKRSLKSHENPLRITFGRAIQACRLLEDSLGEGGMFISQEVRVGTRDGRCKEISPAELEEFAWLTRQTLAPMVFTVPKVKSERTSGFPSVHAEWLAPRSLQEIMGHIEKGVELHTGRATG